MVRPRYIKILYLENYNMKCHHQSKNYQGSKQIFAALKKEELVEKNIRLKDLEPSEVFKWHNPCPGRSFQWICLDGKSIKMQTKL